MLAEVDISGLDKAELLRRLYNNARPLGLGLLHYTPDEMSREEAAAILAQTPYFDYLKGRPLKLDLVGDVLRTDLYNRDQGPGEAERIVAQMRAEESG